MKGYFGVVLIFVFFIIFTYAIGSPITFRFEYSGIGDFIIYCIIIFIYIVLGFLFVIPVRYFNANGRVWLWVIWIIGSVVPGMYFIYMKYIVNIKDFENQDGFYSWDFLLWEVGIPFYIGIVQAITTFILLMRKIMKNYYSEL